MSERMESFLNTMTILGMVLVGFILVVSVALGVMLAAGMFNEHYEPLAGLKFNKTEAQVIQETEGKIWLTVTANTAEIYDDVIIDDTVDSEIILTVINSNNIIENNIIEVPSKVKKGVPFAVKAKVADDGYNVGGICYIKAETSDMMYRVAEPIEIRVDVPVEEVILHATDSYTNNELELETTQFIYQDKAQLSVTVMPERSKYIFGDKSKTKAVTYVSSTPQNVDVELNTGELDVVYNPVYNESEPVTAPLETESVTAKVQKYSIHDQTFTNVVTASRTMGLFPLQLGKILINNPDFAESNTHFETKLFSTSNVLKISAEDTGMSDVINLKVYLQPTIIKEGRGEGYNPLSDLSEFTISASVKTAGGEGATQDASKLFDIQEMATQNQGKNVKYWIIKPKRLLTSDEEVCLSMNLLSKDESFAITRDVVVSEVKVDERTFVYKNANNIEIPSKALTLEITKDDDDPTNNVYGQPKQINYYFDASNASFKKVVHFVTKSGAVSAEHININETNSQIIVANTETLQLEASANLTNSFLVDPRGAGKVNITSYLVRTNEDGLPVDVSYNIITTDSTKAAQKGYVLAKGFCNVADIDSATEGQYIVHQEFPKFDVTVREKLNSFTIYSDTSFEDSKKLTEFTMGTSEANKLTLYAKPNSALAIPGTATEWSTGAYPGVTLSESTGDNSVETIFDLVSNITHKPNSYGNNGQQFTDNYQRWFTFSLSTTKASDETTAPQRTLLLNWGNSGDATMANKTSFRVTTTKVAVEYISLVEPNKSGINVGGDYYKWQLYPHISDKAIYEYKDVTDDLTKTETYYRLKFVSQTSGNGDLILPKSESFASEADTASGLIKAPSSSSTQTSLFLFDNSKLVTDPIVVDGVSYNSIDNVMITLNSTLPSVTAEFKKKLWQKVAGIMDSVSGSSISADNIAKLSGSNLYIKSAIPSGYSLYLFYCSGTATSYEELFEDVAPIAIQLNYSWPTFTSEVKGYNLPDGVKDETGAYRIYGDDANVSRTFSGSSFSTAELSYVNATNKTVKLDVAVDREISLPTDGSMTMSIESTYNSLTSKSEEVLKFTLNNTSLSDNTPIEVTVNRTIRFSVMSDADWKSIKDKADNNGKVTDTAAVDKLKNENNLVRFLLPTEKIKFVVQQIPATGGETAEGEGSE